MAPSTDAAPVLRRSSCAPIPPGPADRRRAMPRRTSRRTGAGNLPHSPSSRASRIASSAPLVYHTDAIRGATIGVAVLRFCFLILVAAAAPAQVLYEIAGRISPEGRASVTPVRRHSSLHFLHFHRRERPLHLQETRGRDLHGGSLPARTRRSAPDHRSGPEPGRLAQPHPTHHHAERRDFDPTSDRRRHAVTARELTIPDRALRDYADAQRDLEKHDVEAAEKHLEHAVELAPQFATAWNTLGTIAYQTRRFPAGRAALPPGAEAGSDGLRAAGQSGRRAGHPAQAG